MTLEDALGLVRRLGADGPVWIVGGFLRDRELGRESPDLDLACAQPAGPLARKAARALGGRAILLDETHGVWRIILKPLGSARGKPAFTQIDLQQLQGDTIEKDLARRDFTMNAMGLLVHPGPRTTDHGIIDPFDGLKDLKAGVIRMVSAKAFTEDGLRLLRAYRFASELGMSLEPATAKAVRAKRKAIVKSAGERVRFELLRLFEGTDAARVIREMEAAGLLTTLFPEMAKQRRCARVYYGEDGVMGHSLLVLQRLEELLGALKTHYPDLEPQLRAHLGSRDTPAARYAALLKLTALIHDIAKPATAKPVGGRLRFFGHEDVGATMADRRLDRMRFSKDERRAVAQMIRYHLRPGNLAANPTVSDKAIFRFFDELKGEGVGLLLVCWADYASYLSDADLAKVLAVLKKDASITPKKSGLAEPLHKTYRHLQVVGLLLHAWFKRKKTVAPPRLVDGNDVIKVTGLKPGPEIGRILDSVRESQAEGKLTTREDVLSFLKTLKK